MLKAILRRTLGLFVVAVFVLLPGNAPAQDQPKLSVDEVIEKMKTADESDLFGLAGELSLHGEAAVKAVPALLEALSRIEYLENKLPWVLRDTICAIGPSAIAPVLRALKDAKPEMRNAAAYVIVYFGPEAREAVADLTALLEDKVARCYAVHALGAIRDQAAAAVPALVKCLDDSDASFRAAVAGALGSVGPKAEAALAPLLKTLGDSKANVRAAAAGALGAIKSARPVPDLIKAMNDDDDRVKDAAMQALGEIGPPAAEAVPALVEMMRCSQACDALSKIGSASVPALIKAMNDDDYRVKHGAMRALGEMVPPAAEAILALVEMIEDSEARDALEKMGSACVPALMKTLGNANGEVRGNCVKVLGRLRPVTSEVRDALLGLLGTDKDPKVRLEIAYEIGRWATEAASVVPALTETLRDSDADVRLNAVYSLGRFGPAAKSASLQLISMLRDSDETARNAATDSLCQIGAPPLEAIPDLMKRLSDGNERVRRTCAWLLGQLGAQAKPAVDALAKALDDKDPQVRNYAAEALGLIGPGAAPAADALARCLRDPEPAVRISAAFALGAIGDKAKPHTKALTELLQDKESRVRVWAALALARLASLTAEAGMPIVLEALKTDCDTMRSSGAEIAGAFGPNAAQAVPLLRENLKGLSTQVRKWSAWALGCIGQGAKDAMPALKECLQDADDEVRSFAQEAINKIGGK
ncbi:MAG: HEAT repeat domain-containing protein [Planctomycetota bacterium]|nr:HEAT repeat domain-containing protein [Planctomycetota bacterium]